MPGLCLTFAQACRLWQIDGTTCQALLDTLMCEKFLQQTAHGAYFALSTPKQSGSPAKAVLRAREGKRVPKTA